MFYRLRLRIRLLTATRSEARQLRNALYRETLRACRARY